MNLNGNFALVPSVAILEQGNSRHAGHKMQNDSAEGNAKKFRDYAAECRRLAQRASDKDRKVLIEIADAWLVCAADADRKGNSSN